MFSTKTNDNFFNEILEKPLHLVILGSFSQEDEPIIE